ncbi:MAG: hypothetical protein ABSB91_06985 [Sedimentisphaerales bacterium]|jgi:hypothetical protein
MKKYILAFLVLCLIEGLAGWRNATQPKEPQSRVITAIEFQTTNGPAYLVCVETTDDSAVRSASIYPEHKMPKPVPDKQETQISGFNLFPEPVTIALLAFCGYLLGGRR